MKCEFCGKKIADEPVSFSDFRFLKRIRLGNGKTHCFCSEICLNEFKTDFLVEIYKEKPIYKIGDLYVPYLECQYGYKNIEDCKKRLDLVGTAVMITREVKE